ncbi:CdaR family protein [Paenibacillus sp. sgz5001063]|uniref:CdaR family protein n=1 Tax=Paenibacillus sp. sgz5001063 TaxID=3242474 RepID=UPI0036D24139
MDKWMKNNNFNKILALAFAIILWIIVHVDTAPANQTTVSTESKTIENVKIEDTGFDEDKYVITSRDADSVRLEVMGKKSDLTYKFSDAYKVWIDLSNIQPGDSTLPLHYSLPSGVILEDIKPNEVNVHVELRNTKSFPVSIVTKGEPAPGYQVGTPALDPAAVEAQVTLAASELSKVVKVQGTIELDGESETLKEKKLKLYAYDSSGNEIKDAVIEPSAVTVELPITLPFKSLPLDISFSGQLPGGLALSKVIPEQDTVTVYGTEEALASLSSYEATLNLSSIDSVGTKELKLELAAPKNVAKIEPTVLNVSVMTSEIAQKTIDNIPIKLEGVDTGLTARITDPASKTISLIVSGAPNLLEQVDKNNISVVADVVGITAGTHVVTLHVSLPRFIALENASQRLRATVEMQTPATPEATKAPDSTHSGTVTSEPSAEPASGVESPTEPAQSEGGISPTATPTPSEGTVENNGTSGTEGTANNSGSPGAT